MLDKRLSQLSGVLKNFNDREIQVKYSNLCSKYIQLMTIETQEDISSCITGLLGMSSRLLGKGETSSITSAYLNSDIRKIVVEKYFVDEAHVLFEYKPNFGTVWDIQYCDLSGTDICVFKELCLLTQPPHAR